MNPIEEEPLIIARLKAGVAASADPFVQKAKVASSASIAGTVDFAPLLPAIFLAPDESDVPSASSDGRAVIEERGWLVVVALGHVPDMKNLSSAYHDTAGALLALVYDQLAGWAPGPGFRPMRYAGRAVPEVAPGHVEFPMRFTVRRGGLAAGS